ncbi:FHA domain-containing protein [Oscillochloris trichoides DG-6]|uniref:FHA domain-containing protein n=1 Tax=Oscillochloris trichoides DG-6 TaxID=765420 RepID=E1IDS8_9CHLR|nr:FHA domain-containing protein [Oscillochloris trichoides DG-6]
MLDRTAIEKETQDTRRQLAAMEKEVKQLRDWMANNERALAGMNETLRRITEDGITKARADLALREGDLQRMRGIIARNEKILARINDIARKRKDIATLEQEQERLIVLLERHRTELRQLEQEFEEMVRPTSAPSGLVPCEIVLPNNYRIPLDPGKGNYMIGWYDASAGTRPRYRPAPSWWEYPGRQPPTCRGAPHRWAVDHYRSGQYQRHLPQRYAHVAQQ